MMSRSKYRSSAEICADCGASDPTWASINRGILLCAECCSVHRSMGRHISHIKSLRQGTWPPSLLAMIQTATAQNVNCIWEHSLLDTSAPKHLRKKPQPKDPLHPTKWEFIQAKHARLAWVLRARREEPAADRGRQLHAAVRSGSLDTALRLLAQGADPNYYHEEKGCGCLHGAARAGQAAQCELLAAWGALLTAPDRAGATPADLARAAGHAALAARLWQLSLEAVDRLSAHLTGARPQRPDRRPWLPPPALSPSLSPSLSLSLSLSPSLHMTDGAKAARGKLQLLPNHLFEELVMDIYDEVDRRETETIWQLECEDGGGGGTALSRCGVAFLPVDPALSAPRNQARQKLARLSDPELGQLVRDALADAARRQRLASLRPLLPPCRAHSHSTGASQPPADDDEPLYDSVASDDDYALLPAAVTATAALQPTANGVPRAGETVSSAYNPSLPEERPQSGAEAPSLESLRRQLASRDCTISALRRQLTALQGLVEQLTRDTSALRPPGDGDGHGDGDGPQPELSLSLPLATPGCAATAAATATATAARGRRLDPEPCRASGTATVAAAAAERGPDRGPDQGAAPTSVPAPAPARPVSMFETTERPDRDWQVAKQQPPPTPAEAPAGVPSAVAAPSEAPSAVAVPSAAAGVDGTEVESRAELLSRALAALWAAAREQRPLAAELQHIARACRHLLQLFPAPVIAGDGEDAASSALQAVTAAHGALRAACEAPPQAPALPAVRQAAYELARATKALVTLHRPPPS